MYVLTFTHDHVQYDQLFATLEYETGGKQELDGIIVPELVTDDGTRVVKRVFISDGTEEFWVSVQTHESEVKWSATVVPANPALQASVTASGTGPTTSDAYLLDKGSYTFTATYSDNVYYRGVPMPIDIVLPVYANNRVQDVVEIVPEEESEKGTVSGSFALAQRSIVWLDTLAMDWASWTVTIDGKFTATSTPKVTGTLAVGRTLAADVGTWAPAPVKLAYQWYRGSTVIKGATKKTYTLAAADKGKTIKVKVTGTKSGFTTISKTSKPTKAVKAGTLTTANPKISGTAKVGKKLKAKAGTWGPGTVKKTYQWYRGSTKIKGATKSSYTLKKADKGKKITVKVKGSKSGYASATKTSKATSKVK